MNVPSRFSFSFLNSNPTHYLSTQTLYHSTYKNKKRYNKNKNKGLTENGYGTIIKFNLKLTRTFQKKQNPKFTQIFKTKTKKLKELAQVKVLQ